MTIQDLTIAIIKYRQCGFMEGYTAAKEYFAEYYR